jgi:hypothetical protein
MRAYGGNHYQEPWCDREPGSNTRNTRSFRVSSDKQISVLNRDDRRRMVAIKDSEVGYNMLNHPLMAQHLIHHEQSLHSFLSIFPFIRYHFTS